MKDLSKKSKKKKDPVKSKIIRSIFEIDDIPTENPQKANKLKIDYNKTIYFNKGNTKQIKEDMSKYLTNALKSNQKELETDQPIDNLIRTVKVNSNPLALKSQPKRRSDSSLIKNNDLKDIQWDNTIDSMSNFGLMKDPSLASTAQSANFFFKTTNLKQGIRVDYEQLLFVPCMNCGSNIPISKIEAHSLKCTKVSEEVMKNETNAYELYPINYKLKRLKEHVSNIANGSVEVPKEFEKEIKYISTVLLQYLSDTLSLELITLASIKEFKKTMKNLETLSVTYKASISSLILIDRTKVLVNEKHKIFRESFRMQANTRRTNNKKTGYLEYETKIKEEIKKIQQIELETELEKTKVKNLRKSATPKEAPKLNGINVHSLPSNADYDDIDDDFLRDLKLNDQIDTSGLQNKIEDIISDVGNHSQVFSDNTSISMIMSDSQGDENNLPINPNKITLTVPNSDETQAERPITDLAKEKREFFKQVLKIKFEKLHSTHKGLHTPQKLIWEESKKMNISRKKWNEFILGELNCPLKYINMVKNKNKFVGNSITPTMSVIDEEKI